MNKTNSSNRKIGGLVFQIIDDIMSGGKSRSKTRSTEELHYLEQLIHEPSQPARLWWRLKTEIMHHPLIRKSISERAINAELLSLFRTDQDMRKIRQSDPEKIGRDMVNNLVEQRSAKVVTFPLQGILPRNKISRIGSAILGTLRNILDFWEVPECQLPDEDEPHYEPKQCLRIDATNYEKMNLRIISIGTNVAASDSNAAVNLAEKELNLALNIIRLLIPLEYSITNRPRISFYDLQGIDEALIISLPSGEREVFRQLSPSTYPFLPPVHKYRVKDSIDAASEIAGKNEVERSDLENRILSAINWVGEGIDSIDKDVKVVKCVIGLEVLFKLEDTGKQRQFIDEVIRIFGSSKIDKKLVGRHAKKIYELRSKIVHGGHRDITDEEAQWAERIASGCVLRTLENMATNDEEELESKEK